MTTSSAAPIVVVGAGVIGLSTALHLRETCPDREVVVLEAGAVGDGTTPAGAGFVARWATVLPHLGEAGLALADYSLDFYRRLAADGADLRFRANGNLVLFNERGSMDAAIETITTSPWYGDDNRVVDPGEIAELTAGAVDADRVAGGIHMSSGIQLETGLTLARMADVATAAGVTIEPHTAVRSVHAFDGRLEGLEVTLPDGGSAQLQSDAVVLAVGAWLNPMLADVGWRLPLLPFVATRFVTEDVGVPATMPTIQAKDFPLWIRESEGGFTWGSTPGCAPAHRLDDAWQAHDPTTRHRDDLVQAMAADVERIQQVFPALEGAEVVRVVQGMPVYTVDRQFFAGPVPGCAGLWAVGGDNESGVSHGPALGRLMAELVGGADRPICDATSYRLDRFAPGDYPDAEAVGQEFVRLGGNFIAEAMTRPVARVPS